MNRGERRRLGMILVVCVAVISGALAASAEDALPTLSVAASDQTLRLSVELPKDAKVDTAVKAWQLVEVDHPGAKTPAELTVATAEDGSVDQGRLQLIAAVAPRPGADSPRRFRLQPAEKPVEDAFRLEDINETSLKLSEAAAPVFVYNHGTITDETVPEKDPRRSRSCYVHPLWGIGGEVLTDDFPRDHYHHHGLFWAWPHVEVDAKKYDLWLDRGIKQRFVGWIQKQAGPVSAVLAVENGWFVDEKKVMTERVWLRSFKAEGDSRVLDVEIVIIPEDKPVTLRGAAGKGYGGLCVRYAVEKGKRPTITVPGGIIKEDLANAPLAWCDMTGQFSSDETRSGATIFVSPNHPAYPPAFLTRHYGPICVGHPGSEAKTFPPGVPVRLNYCIWIHKDAVDLERLEKQYDAYKAASAAEWK